MIKYLFTLLCILVLCSFQTVKPGKASIASESASESNKVNDFLDRKFDEAVARSPENASTLGLKINYGEWSDRSDNFVRKEIAIAKQNLA